MRPARPARSVAGLLLVVSAIVAALALYGELGERSEVLAVTRTVLAGEQITRSDLRVVSISSEDDLPMIAASDRALVVGQYARVRLASGALLVADGVQPTPLVNPDMVLMSVEVPIGQVPVGLREQSRIVLIVTAGRAGGSSEVAAPVLVEATVVSVPGDLADIVGGPSGGSAVLALSVEVPEAYVALVGTADEVSVGVLDPSATFPGATAAEESIAPPSGESAPTSTSTPGPTSSTAASATTARPTTTLPPPTTIPTASPFTTGATNTGGSVG